MVDTGERGQTVAAAYSAHTSLTVGRYLTHSDDRRYP